MPATLSIPAQSGYRMPAEWAPHAATWLTWPRPEGISFPDKYEPVPAVYASFIRELAAVEDVHINVWSTGMEETVREVLSKHKVGAERVSFHHFPSYEPWCRDHGPIFVVREAHGARERAVVDWRYNAWGNKYPPCDLDDDIPRHVAAFRSLPLISPDMVLEGGSIEVNGSGTLMTTEACLLNPNRNPKLTKAQIEQNLRDYLGVTHIIWLGDGIVGDDTDGHIDDLTRFVSGNTVVTVVEEDPADENHGLLQDNLKRLQHAQNQDGEPLKILQLPMPGRLEYRGQRLPASYANFYIANSIIIMPTFRTPNDQRAAAVLQEAFPDRRVIPLDSTDLIWGLGSFHCISQQEPQ